MPTWPPRILATRARRAGAGLAALAALALAVTCARAPEAPAWAAEERELVLRVVASGRVLPPARISLASLALGRVVAVRVDEGDRVEAGDVVLELDGASARAALDEARARLAEAEARLAQVRGVEARTAAEALARAELDAAQAGEDLARARALAQAGSAPAADAERAERAVSAARSRVDAARAQAESARDAGPGFRLALAAVSQARAALAAARVREEETRLLAPAPAVVLTRAVEPGDVVQPGAPLLVLAREGETRLSVQPDERNLALLALGQRARAVADAFPGEPFEAEVSFLSPGVDAARGTVEVRLRVPAPPPFLRPDMTVSVNVEAARRRAGVVVPAEAVREAEGGAPWVLAAANGRAERRAVRLGLRGEGTVEVVDGLARGELVLAPGKAAAGDRVRPAPRPFPGGS